MKILFIICILQSAMIIGCNSGQNTASSDDQFAIINYSGQKISLDKEQMTNLTDRIKILIQDCDDFYELIVTNDLIEEIKKEEKYIEIVFPQQLDIKLGKFGEQKINQVFIPLSGRYASSDQVTFFNGISDYSNTPFSNSKGSAELKTLLTDMIQ